MNTIDFLEPVEIETRSISEGVSEQYIKGKAIVFNKWSSPMKLPSSQREYIEQIVPEAVREIDWSNTLSSVNHDVKNKMLGKRSKGTLDISVDSLAVHYSVKVPNTKTGEDAVTDVRNGNLEGSSFWFDPNTIVDKWDITKEPAQRTILKIGKIIELGPVTIPAYPDTTVAQRSYEMAIEAEKPTIDFEALKEKSQRAKQLFNL